jgi:hypothetical protein
MEAAVRSRGLGILILGHPVADSRCQALAEGAGLSGTFKAWISGRVDTGSGPVPHGAVDRFTQATVPYELVNGTKVADDWADLTDGTLDHAIELDGRGLPIPVGKIWPGQLDLELVDWHELQQHRLWQSVPPLLFSAVAGRQGRPRHPLCPDEEDSCRV